MRLGGRIIESNSFLKSEGEDDKIAYFKSMGQYEGPDSSYSNSRNLKNIMNRLKHRSQERRIGIEEPDSFVSGNGSLKNDDINGSTPTRFHRGRRLFVDRNSIKSVLGQSPGK